MDAVSLSSSLMGLLVPFLTQAVRNRWLPWNDKFAHLLSLLITAGCVSAAYFMQGGHSLTGWLASFGAAFTLNSTIFAHLHDAIDPDPAPIVLPAVPPVAPPKA